jgi:hypothetical protein
MVQEAKKAIRQSHGTRKAKAMRRHSLGNHSELGEIVVESDAENMFVIVGGTKIAKRHDKAWVSLEPGWEVLDEWREGEPVALLLRYNGAVIH